MESERGYIGILMLLIGVAVLAYMYLNYSPLKVVTDPETGATTTEAQLDIQAAQQVKDILEARGREEMQMLQQ